MDRTPRSCMGIRVITRTRVQLLLETILRPGLGRIPPT